MEKKIIHYCWFGGNPLPKLAKKCIKSWKKYLPDYEIIEWNESNVDLEECPFIKGAYEAKKWAFVSDYVRTKAMCEYGGIYFDTDMEVIKNIDDMLKDKGFLGVEDSHMIACGVWYEPKPNSYLAKEMLKFYREQSFFDIDNMYAISIPRIISLILNDYDVTLNETQYLKHNEIIYRRDYFYPYSYDFKNNVFTDSTCMIHYYNASWVPKWQQRENKIYRTFGKKNGDIVIKSLRTSKRTVKKVVKVPLYPLIVYRRKKQNINQEYFNALENTYKELNKMKNKSCVAFVNPYWMGVRNATEELFDNVVHCTELYRKKDIENIGSKIVELNIKEIIFSGFCIGWADLIKYLHKQGIIIKTYFHGSHTQVLEPYGWARNMEIFKLHKKGYIDKIATCKESLVNFYKNQGCDMSLLRNRVSLKPNYVKGNKKIKRIGIYAAKSDDFRKNVFAQIAAASLLNDKDVVVDMIPMTNQAVIFADLLGLKIDGSEKALSRDELLKRMSKNDINLYVTFSECAPMLPIESFSSGVPCLTGNNHHYFKDSELEKYLVVFNEASPIEIKEKMEFCFKNREKVLDLYNKWYLENDKLSKQGVEEYIKIKGVRK